MSSPNHPTFKIEDAFSFNFPDYVSASSNYFPASPGKNSPDSSNDFTKYLLATLVFSPLHDDPYMEEISPPKDTETPIESSILVSPSSSVGSSTPEISPPKDTETPIESSILVSPSSSVGSSTPVRMPLKRTPTSAAPTINQAAIWQLIDDRVAAALKAQAANIANADNTNRNPEPRETLTRTESVFSRSNCTEDCKVKFSTGTLTEDAFSWWDSYAKPIGIEQADKIAWSELKRLLTNKYCPRIEVKKMEDEFYNLVVKENDLKTYARRFQELAVLCPNMVPFTF
nr:reverse transcriptase domain-containing protein [Tanacetum cinerariifolium]